MVFSKILLSVFSAFIMSSGIQAQDIPFPLDKACVAWKTKKTMFLFKRENPIGINCKIDVSFKADETGKGYVIILTAPIKNFDSGNEHRDKDVFEILGGPKQADIIVTTASYSKEDWLVMLDGLGILDLNMKLAGETFTLNIPIEMNNDLMSGNMRANFSDFNIKAPKVAFGLVASVAENLDLAFSIPRSEIKGLSEAISLEKAGN